MSLCRVLMISALLWLVLIFACWKVLELIK